MKKILFPILAISLAACGSGVVNVKRQWTKDLSAYSFVPLYPPRADVSVGDIRIHLNEGGSTLFDSRLMWDREDTSQELQSADPITSQAILPGIDSVRLGAVDIASLGLLGHIGKLLGTRIEASSSLHVALKDLTTSEISDVKIASHFKAFVQTSLLAPAAKDGFCTAAISLNDDKLETARISIITRTISFKSIQYFSGHGVSNQPGKSDSKSKDPSLDGADGFVSTQAASILAEPKIKDPIVIGVDAIMLNPYKLNLGPALVSHCKDLQNIIDAPKTFSSSGSKKSR